MRYYTREEQDKAAKRQIEFYRECAGYFQGIRKVFEDFDGKCLNCRLEKALRERVNPHIIVQKEENYVSVYVYKNGMQYTLAHVITRDLHDKKRIASHLFIESARERREGLLKDAAELEDAMNSIDTIKAQINALTAALDATKNRVSAAARDIYGLNVYVKQC